jgi:hypothetical protein
MMMVRELNRQLPPWAAWPSADQRAAIKSPRYGATPDQSGYCQPLWSGSAQVRFIGRCSEAGR